LWDGINKGNIDAQDLFMALYDLDPALLAFLPAKPYFYFSVTNATKGLVPAAWWGATTPSGASILRMQWTGASWTTPSIWHTYAELGLAVGAELDALAVDEAHGFMLFSTQGNAPDELMFANLNADTIATAVYRYPVASPYPGAYVSALLGLKAG